MSGDPRGARRGSRALRRRALACRRGLRPSTPRHACRLLLEVRRYGSVWWLRRAARGSERRSRADKLCATPARRLTPPTSTRVSAHHHDTATLTWSPSLWTRPTAHRRQQAPASRT